MTFSIEKPEKGAGLLEYIFKYFTIFIVLLIGIWSLFIFALVQISQTGLTSTIYTIGFLGSLIVSLFILTYVLYQLNQKIKRGKLYQIEFSEQNKTVKLSLFNDFKGFEFTEDIPYSDFVVQEKPQKIEIKSELKMAIFNQDRLVVKLNIAKTEWTVHPKIVEIVNTFRQIANNK